VIPLKRYQGVLILTLLTVIAYAFARFQGGHVPWFLFYASLVMTVYAWLIQRFSLSGLQMDYSLSSNQITQGERLDIRVSYRLAIPFPLSWMVIRHMGEGAAFLEEEKQVSFPGYRRQGITEAVTYRLPRGRHCFAGVEVLTGDIFGFVDKSQVLDKREEVLVLPRIYPIRQGFAVHEHNAGQAVSTPRISEDVTSVVGVRDYSNRDRLSRIHWKASARGQGLKVKEFEQQVTHDMLFVLDCRENAQPKTDFSRAFERAVSLTASLIHHAMERRFTAGLLTNGHTPGRYPMGRGQEHLLRMLRHLAIVQMDGPFPLDQVVAQEAPRLNRGTRVILVVTRLGEEIQQAVAHLSHFHMGVECCWVSGAGALTPEEKVSLAKLRRWGVHCIPVTHDNFDELYRGGGSHGGISAAPIG
jgi:uncharacterized protein (DUF58 family)